MNISVIGGDSRIAYLSRMLAKDNNLICLYGMEKCELLNEFNNNKFNNKFKHVNNLKQVLEDCDVVITSIPLSKDGVCVNAVYTDEIIKVKDMFDALKNKTVITGNITKEIEQYIDSANNLKIVDVMKLEELTVLNAIPTAEGAIQIAMERSNITLHNSNCLILGFGRIGKVLSKMLNGIGANVFCEARKEQDLSWITSYGYNPIHLNNLSEELNKFDFIFNTVPSTILDKEMLKLVNKDCMLIDLASKPGGIDFEEAEKLKLKCIWALALPGKVAPKTAAEYIYYVLKNRKDEIQ